jgi:hypothetical protein
MLSLVNLAHRRLQPASAHYPKVFSMWCSNCHQDVAGLPNSQLGQGPLCARCGEAMGRPASRTTFRVDAGSANSAGREEIDFEPVIGARGGHVETQGSGPVKTTTTTASPLASLAALDREIEAVDALLQSWTQESVDDETTSRVTELPHIKTRRAPTAYKKLDPLTASVASTRQNVHRIERQISLLLMAQLTFFISAALASFWSLTNQGQWLIGHLVGVSITGQLCTLFCLTWFVAKLRGVQQRLSDTEVLIVKDRLPESGSKRQSPAGLKRPSKASVTV